MSAPPFPDRTCGERFEPSFAIGAHYATASTGTSRRTAGFDTAIQSARVDDYVYTEFGARRIRDYQIFLPFGGVSSFRRPESVGTLRRRGGVYVRYYEAISQPAVTSESIARSAQLGAESAITDWQASVGGPTRIPGSGSELPRGWFG
jgi:hypothetical protein